MKPPVGNDNEKAKKPTRSLTHLNRQEIIALLPEEAKPTGCEEHAGRKSWTRPNNDCGTNLKEADCAIEINLSKLHYFVSRAFKERARTNENGVVGQGRFFSFGDDPKRAWTTACARAGVKPDLSRALE